MSKFAASGHPGVGQLTPITRLVKPHTGQGLEDYLCHTAGRTAGVYIYFGPKTIFIPPPPENGIFSPSHHMSFSDSHHSLFALILPYFASLFLIFFPLSSFLSTFSAFSLGLLIFFPQMTSADIFSPPQGGRDIFQYRVFDNSVQ